MARLPYPPFTLPTSKNPPVNVIKLLSHSPSTVEHWTGVGTAHYRALLLPKRLRELTILYCAAKFQSPYEWDHHLIVSEKLVTDAERQIIKKAAKSGNNYFEEGERQESGFAQREWVLLRVLEAVTSGPYVEDRLWTEVREAFSEREIVEILSLQVCLSQFTAIVLDCLSV
jgi:alkylhydroperoxidase family enzyme